MKIKFYENKYYNGQLKYVAEKVHEIPEKFGEAERWLKRGGTQVIEEEEADSDDALEALGGDSAGDETVASTPARVENRKGNKSKRQ